MENNVDVLAMLRKAAEAEKKRRSKAVEYLEQLTKELTEAFLPLLGDQFDGAGYNSVEKIGWNLYFRYSPHYGEKEIETEGFYYDLGQHLVWGKTLTTLRGRLFWKQVRKILDWLDNLHETLDDLEMTNKTRLAGLEKIVAAIQAIEG
jgi:hypothetical protein